MSLDAFLVCEDVRLEMQGQLTLVGVFGHVLSVPVLPLVFPKLAVFVRLTGVGTGKHPFSLTIRDETLGADVVAAHGEHGQGAQPDPQLATFRVQFGAVQARSWGPFVFEFALNEHFKAERSIRLRPPSWSMIYVACEKCLSVVPSGIDMPPEAKLVLQGNRVACPKCQHVNVLTDDNAVRLSGESYTMGPPPPAHSG